MNFVAKKLTAMVPVSNDLIRRAPIGVEEVVRDDLVQTIARREDLAFLRGDGTDKGPIGMRHLALPANLITVTAMPATPAPGDQLTAILAGASAAILALQNGMSRMIRPTWIMAPTIARFIATARDQVGGFYFKDEIERGMFEGYPIRLTQQIPTNLVMSTYTKASEIYFVDMADFVIADTYNVVVDASDVAAYNDGVSMVSAFQRDQSLFRVIAEHDCQHAAPSIARRAVDAGLGLLGRAGGAGGAVLDATAQSDMVASRRHPARAGDRRERAADAYRPDLRKGPDMAEDAPTPTPNLVEGIPPRDTVVTFKSALCQLQRRRVRGLHAGRGAKARRRRGRRPRWRAQRPADQHRCSLRRARTTPPSIARWGTGPASRPATPTNGKTTARMSATGQRLLPSPLPMRAIPSIAW